MTTKRINIGEDFSKVPRGRYHSADGQHTGGRFREHFLKEIFNNPEKYSRPVEIVLDSAEGYGSSFLEEAFGGLVRKGYASSEEVDKAFVFIYEDKNFEFYEKRIREYIREALSEE